ncbi:Hypothetical protein I595_3675 [Croceitalea dokdonensis DOKDO 023]|uniref:Uncharacterized protein n=1 Tax=Croceitalea dokdonensis DOKDO 023 TaxID=1300341 RepID=A0A0P7AV76_9FLAO|nr:Hypothetical protein I595_3675 [Croceitalea dokdonensis DOKDO 023]
MDITTVACDTPLGLIRGGGQQSMFLSVGVAQKVGFGDYNELF